MKKKSELRSNYSFERFASSVTKATGTTAAFMVAFLIIIIWVVAGPLFHYSETWQTFISTGATIITFLMVFLIQKTQNKHSLAIQLKLNELVAANEIASNRLLNAENMTEEELKVIHKYYTKLSDFAKKEETLQQPHSIDEVHHLHDIKNEMEQELKDTEQKNDDTRD
ncbi:low affinity iron permease family protein [Ginsengibacter hankyongi]|uniref:Low affinity iron permease family protein n=1 Tax=Ginsengibacter hankyongi TaxID=2607284 RepID=A0A5J5ILP7_9BACT|nr:low affinity iron permease family protein [Ginsengibacter hankyongi]KAA9040794.1 low affinity iron permease family protein [Ginsengibacter hankyongi]